MKTALKIFILFISCSILNAQETKGKGDRSPWETSHRIEFAYDDAGNRISKEIVFPKNSRSKMAVDSLDKKTVIKEYIAKHEIRIYPNPTYGQLSIEIPTIENGSQPWSIAIHKLNGNLLQSQLVSAKRIDLDITSYETGLYILFIKIGTEQSRWKIIKK